MVDMQYVFEIEGIPRDRRKYYKVRYSFKAHLKDEIEPDEEGETYKYVVGTTYTPLELFIVNNKVKGPQWIKIRKEDLTANSSNNVDNGLCVDMRSSELMEVVEGREPPTVRVMSFSIREIVPGTISKRKAFPRDKDDSQLYAISYHYCPEYRISIKEERPTLHHRTFYLEAFGKAESK
jgi:hypothetical protein